MARTPPGLVLTVLMLMGCEAFQPPQPPPIPDFPSVPDTAADRALADADEELDVPPLASGRSFDEAESRDVLARVELLRSEVALLRRTMGRPETRPPRLRVSEVPPRAVYQQARGLFDASNALSFELGRTLGNTGAPPAGEPQPSDVLAEVNRALVRVRIARRSLVALGGDTEEHEADEAEPANTFHEVLLAKTEINALLQRHTGSSAVFQEVTAALHLAVAIQSRLGGALPEEPALEPFQTPSDVYRTLLSCYEVARELAATRDVSLVTLRVSEADAAEATDQDALDLATLLRSEMAHLHATWPDVEPAFRSHDPGFRVPSHVEQRARLLQLVLEDARQRAR
ncbi:MAG: hypothetical protein AB8I08_40095 [Sandaracinaceae bacterium]